MGEARAAQAADLEIRPPKQRRSREAWNRVLDAGVSILEDGGYEAFTIAARLRAGRGRAAGDLCPHHQQGRSLPRRLRTRHPAPARGAAGLLRQQPMGRPVRGRLVRAAVAETVGMFLRHERFLRAVVLTSASHPEIRRRGSRYSQELGNGFARVVLRVADAITLPDVETAVHSCFSTVFAASVIRVAYGPGFARPMPVEDDAFIADLAETAVRYLLSA